MAAALEASGDYRLPKLLAWLAKAKPDVACLQGLKAAQHALPAAAIPGYHTVWQGQPSRNGVAILARGAAPVVTQRSLPGDPDDSQIAPNSAINSATFSAIRRRSDSGTPVPFQPDGGRRVPFRVSFMAAAQSPFRQQSLAWLAFAAKSLKSQESQMSPNHAHSPTTTRRHPLAQRFGVHLGNG